MPIMTKCPATGETVASRLLVIDRMTWNTVKSIGPVTEKCPVCGDKHTWTKDNAWFED